MPKCQHSHIEPLGVQYDARHRPALRLYNCTECGTTLAEVIVMKININTANEAELYNYIEKFLDDNHLNDKSESWEECADRIETDKPQIANFLRHAANRWHILQA